MARLPNFFVIGAPRCGTTALCSYLATHPRVFLSTPKEPHYYATDLPGFRDVTQRSEYEQLFSNATAQQTRVGEASVFYLFSQQAARLVQADVPDARIIVMLRNPVDLVESLHAHLLFTRNENQPQLKDAWRLRSHRREGLAIPAGCRDAKILRYDEIARFGAQTARWLKYFRRNQLHFVFFEELVRDTQRVYHEVLDFLGLPDDGRRDFPIVNARRQQRVTALANFTERTPDLLIRAAMTAKRWLGLRRWGILSALRRWNSQDAPEQAFCPATRAEIAATYHDDLLDLGEFVERDLSPWLCETKKALASSRSFMI